MKDNLMSWEEAILWLREQPNQENLVRFCYYDDPLSESAARFHHSTEWKAVQAILADIQRGKVLDVGAGRGISSYALDRDGWQVTALEPDPSTIVGSGAIKQLRRVCAPNIRVIEEYGETLPFENNSFDLVYGRAVLHHADNLKKFCLGIARILKPGGLFILTREHVISQKSDLQTFLDSHPLHSLYGGENAFLLKEYRDALRDAGLKIQKVLGPYDSDINLFPENQKKLKNKISQKMKIPIPGWMAGVIFAPLLTIRDNTPGRLYSFVGIKP